MFYYHDETEIDGGLIKLAVLRSDLAPIPETLEMDIRLDNTNRELLQEGKDIYVGSGRAYRIVLAEISRRTAQQGVRLIETVSITAVLRELQALTFVRERAIWLEDATLTDIYRACGAELQTEIKGDVTIPVYHCMVGDTPTFGIAKLFQEHGGVLRVNSDGELEFMRLTAIFDQEPVLYLPANVTEEITSGFIERHELPWFFSIDAGNNFVLGNNTKPRHVRYIHRASEDVLRNMTRVLIQSKRARVDVNMSICAGDCAELSDGTKQAVLTAAHHYATGTDGVEVSQYTRVWLGVLTGTETEGGGTIEVAGPVWGGLPGDDGDDGDDEDVDLAASLPDWYLVDASYSPGLRNYRVFRTGKSDDFDITSGVYVKIDGLYTRPGYSEKGGKQDRIPFSLDNADIYFVTLSDSEIEGGTQITWQSGGGYSLGKRCILCEKVVSIIDGVPVRAKISPTMVVPCRFSGHYETWDWSATSVYVGFDVDIPIFDNGSYDQWSAVIVSLLHRAANGTAYTFIFDADRFPGTVYTNRLLTQGGDNYTLSWALASSLSANAIDPSNRLPYASGYIQIKTGIPENPKIVPR